MLAAGGLAGVFASNMAPQYLAKALPVTSQIPASPYFSPVVKLAVGGAGYYFGRKLNESAAVGFFVACAANAGFELVSQFMNKLPAGQAGPVAQQIAFQQQAARLAGIGATAGIEYRGLRGMNPRPARSRQLRQPVR